MIKNNLYLYKIISKGELHPEPEPRDGSENLPGHGGPDDEEQLSSR